VSYVALYRKFRPGTFAQVTGQDHVVRALTNQLANRRIGHAYLFTGTRGTGKTSVAKIFAKAVNCLHPNGAEPCNECENCRSINAGSFVDVAEVDAASNNGVDDIRQIIEEVRYTPVKGAYKVFIIDEAHMITGPAFNAFLKTLEEPPAYAVFILATTEPHKLPVTILSRCQRYDFRRISTDQISGNLKYILDSEGVEAQEKAIRYIARMGDGSMRDSVSLLDKCIAFNLGEKLTYENVLDTLGTVDTVVFSALFRSIYAADAANALNIIDQAAGQGRDLSQFATDFIWYLRNVLMTGASAGTDMEMLGVSAENMALIEEDARTADPVVLMRYIQVMSELIDRLRFSSSKQILLEVAVIKLARPQMEEDVHSLADRVRQLEAKIADGRFAVSGREHGSRAVSGMTNPDVFAGLIDDVPADAAADAAGPALRPVQPEALQDPQAQRSVPGDSGMLWSSILSNCDNRRIRSTLSKCNAGMAGEDVLEINAPNDFLLKQLKDESVTEYLKQLSERIAGRPIQLKVRMGNEIHHQEEADPFPDELLKNINFNIGTEEW